MKSFIKRIFNCFISFLVKLFSNIAFLKLSVIFILLIFNVVASLARYNRFLDLN